MDSTGAGRTRDAERTRRAILAAAETAMTAEGPNASLATIAAEAGVSKSGLLHHFASRELLIRELGEASMAAFRTQVSERVDLGENEPGKLLRAYVRAVCDAIEGDDYERRDPLALWLVLATEPSMRAVVSADIAYWDTELARDGLDPTTIAAVQMAADGLALMGVIDLERARMRVGALREELLGRTRPRRPR